jgi:serine phosphatase RsbU (regulator of sigma subunit)
MLAGLKGLTKNAEQEDDITLLSIHRVPLTNQ